jgi:hypothetical protein
MAIVIPLALDLSCSSPPPPASPAPTETRGVNDERPLDLGHSGLPPFAVGTVAAVPAVAETPAATLAPVSQPALRAADAGPPGGTDAGSLEAAPSLQRLARADFEAAALAAGWPGDLLADAYYVACGDSSRGYHGESGCIPGNWNGAGPFAGLLQILWPFWWTGNNAGCRGDPERWAEPVENLRIGWCIYSYYGGWSQWPNTAPRPAGPGH